MTSLVSSSTLARLEQLQLHNRERLVGRFAGEHSSTRFGDSVDFADFRQYHPGDDFRRIDYHALARLDQLLIKLFEADDSITTRILFDASASMATGNKLLQAKRVAAMLGFVGLIGHDTVSLSVFPDGPDVFADGPAGSDALRRGAPRRFTGRHAFPHLAQHLEGLEAVGPTPFARAAGDLIGRGGHRGVTFVISDLLTEDWASLVRLRADRSLLVVVQVLDRSDRTLTFEGDVDLVDEETGSRLPVSSAEETKIQFEDAVARFVTAIGARCRSVGAVHFVVDADEDVEELLLSTWRAAEVVR